MIISTKKGTPQVELDRIVDNFEKQGLSVTLIRGTDYNVFGLPRRTCWQTPGSRT